MERLIMTTNTASTGPVWDWAAGHGPVTGALSATTGCLAVATTGAATGMPPAGPSPSAPPAPSATPSAACANDCLAGPSSCGPLPG